MPIGVFPERCQLSTSSIPILWLMATLTAALGRCVLEPADGRDEHRNARHLSALINDVLELARIEADQFELHLQGCSVASILAELQSVLTPLAAERGIPEAPER
jgi:signal transduction histidine kinase